MARQNVRGVVQLDICTEHSESFSSSVRDLRCYSVAEMKRLQTNVDDRRAAPGSLQWQATLLVSFT